jgi:hypothetical protein
VAAHVGAQRRQVDALSLRRDALRQIWTVLEDLVTEDLGVAPRLADGLFDAFFGRPITNRYYRQLCDVSVATATGDLARLEASGLLASRGRGRATEYTGTGALIDRVAGAVGIPVWGRTTVEPLEQRRGELIAAIAATVATTPRA